MSPTENAQRHHDELFPDHVSTLARTDPELIEYFDNFAFDEVVEHGRLDVRTRLMAQLAALIAIPALAEYKAMLGAALTVGVSPVEAKEIVYHAVPYVGMGKAFDFLHATNEVLTGRGIELPLPGQSRSGSSASRRSRPCTPTPPRTSYTSSGGCRRTASAITTPVADWTWPPGRC